MATLNIHRIIDVQTIISATPPARRDFRNFCFVFKGTQVNGTRVNAYTSYADVVTAYGSNSEPAKAALTFYQGGFNGLKPISFWVANFDSSLETWAEATAAIISDPRYYLVALENGFTVQENKDFMGSVEASTEISYFNSAVSFDRVAATATQANDTNTSIVGWAKTGLYTKSLTNFADISASAEYLNVADQSYFATVAYTKNRPLGSLAFKQFAGQTPVDLSFNGTFAKETAANNLSDKNCNYYTAFGEVGRNIAYNGVVPNGTQANIIIGADWLQYNMTYAIFDLLVSLPNLKYTNEDFNKVYSVIDSVCQQSVQFGLLASGTDQQTGINYPNGYAISIPDPKDISTTDKANGLLTGITVIGLIAGTVIKIEVTNILKY